MKEQKDERKMIEFRIYNLEQSQVLWFSRQLVMAISYENLECQTCDVHDCFSFTMILKELSKKTELGTKFLNEREGVTRKLINDSERRGKRYNQRRISVVFYKTGMEWPSNGNKEMGNTDATRGITTFTVVSCQDSSVLRENQVPCITRRNVL